MILVRRQLGSPPRMRGKARAGATRQSCTRITPAYAGKSIYPAIACAYAWDHPRVCGEKWFSTSNGWKALGSPPRMRGKVAQHLLPAFRRGITPAYAGKSTSGLTTILWCRDHPRVCGEKADAVTYPHQFRGSPPRMRGKGRYHHGQGCQGGITPAYAGKSVCL